MKIIIAIGIGSFIGGILRYLVTLLVSDKYGQGFPFGTLMVNIAGCFLIGIVYGFFNRGQLTDSWRLFLATGILGGFTTFSAFSYESISLLKNGSFTNAFLYITLSVVVGLVATFAGLSLFKTY